MAAQWACTNRSNENAPVTVADSAGITIVTNERAPEYLAHWRTEPVLTIGQLDGPEEYSFGLISDVEVDARGQVYVLDRQAQQAMAYGSDGRFRFRVGGPGEGPGEFSNATVQVRVGPRDSILVLDGWQMRLTVFDPNGTPTRTLPMRHSVRPGPYQFHLLGDGRLLVRWFTYNPDSEGKFVPWDVLLLSNVGQTSFDTLMAFDYRPPEFGTGDGLLLPLFVNAAFYDVLTDGRIVWSALEHDQFAVHALDGSLQRIVRNQRWRRRAATSTDREALADVFRAGAENPDDDLLDRISYPDTVPTVTAVVASPDGGFWVRRMGSLSELDPQALHDPFHAGWLGGTTWEVYDREGRWYATVEVPRRFRVTRVRDSAVVGVQRDEMDVERVVVVRVLR
jgi:hypothetical protein